MKLKGFSNYEIYPNEGKVWSYKKKRFIGSKNPKGYYMVTMYDDEGNKTHRNLYRVIWECVNGEIPEGYEVNHIDENRENNAIQNLNLLTHKDNVNWGTGNIKRSKTLKDKKHLCKEIVAVMDGEVVMSFTSATEAEEKGYGSRRCISRCCVGRQKTYLGYKWLFLDKWNEMKKVVC